MDCAANSEPPRPKNQLLATLRPSVFQAIRPHLTAVEITVRQVLHEAGAPIRSVYFLETGWVSMLAHMENGDSAEVGLIGSEGFVGLPLLLASDSDDTEAMVQGPGTALKMDAAAFRSELERQPAFRTLLLRYMLVHYGQVTRTAACNWRHNIQQRLARWLLMAHDRAEANRFPMTHEFLSMMLAVRRAGVTMAAGALQERGVIRYERGAMEVVDRPRLERMACECYGIARSAQDRLFHAPLAWPTAIHASPLADPVTKDER